MKRLIWLPLLLVALFVTACGSGGLQTTDSGLQYEILTEGEGPMPVEGDRVRVDYTGTLEDGTEFDSSRQPGREPFEFVIGSGSVIAGWDEALRLLPEGSTAKLVIPPDLAYGAADRPGIPGNSTLNFEVELLEIIVPPEPLAIDDSDYQVTDSGLRYHHINQGSGDMPVEGEIAYIHYVGWIQDGIFLIDSHEGGQPTPIVIGQNQVIAGWDEGVQLMRPGGVTQFVIPPELGLGEQGGGPIPPNSTLVFQLELVSVEPAPPTPTPAPPPTDVDESAFMETESGIRYAVLEEGDGPMPVDGQTVSVHYTGWLTDGTRFDSSLGGTPLSFTVGEPGLIEGWQETVRLMPLGSKFQVYIPPELGYGPQGRGPIPPDATLIFEMELIDISD